MAHKHANFFERYKHIILTFELNMGHFRRCWYTWKLRTEVSKWRIWNIS